MYAERFASFGLWRWKRRPAYAAVYWLVAVMLVLMGVAALRVKRHAPVIQPARVGNLENPWFAERARQAGVSARAFGEKALKHAAQRIYARRAWFNSLAIDRNKKTTLIVRLADRIEHNARGRELLRLIDSYQQQNSDLAAELSRVKADYRMVQDRQAAELARMEPLLKVILDQNPGLRKFDPRDFKR